MAVRRTKSPKSNPLSVPPPEDPELTSTRRNAQVWDHVRRLLFYRNEDEVIAVLVEEHGKSYQAARSLIRRVRARTDVLGEHLRKIGKNQQIVALHVAVSEAEIQIRNERIREEAARKEGKKYSPPRNLPTHAEVRGYHELIARLEGNFAPTKTVQVNTFVGQEMLEFLGVSSVEEVAGLIEDGRRVVETEGVPTDG